MSDPKLQEGRELIPGTNVPRFSAWPELQLEAGTEYEDEWQLRHPAPKRARMEMSAADEAADRPEDDEGEDFLHAAPDHLDSYSAWGGDDAEPSEPEQLSGFEAELQQAVEQAARRAQQHKAQQAAKRDRRQAGQPARRPAADDALRPAHGLPESHYLPVHQEEWARQICWRDSPGRAAASEEREDSDITGLALSPAADMEVESAAVPDRPLTEAGNGMLLGLPHATEPPEADLQAFHPQMLRLTAAGSAPSHLPQLGMEAQWATEDQGPRPLLLDMNDPLLTFELLRQGKSHTALLNKAAATVLPARPPEMGPAALQDATRFNISRDKHYGRDSEAQLRGHVYRHAVSALSLTTLPWLVQPPVGYLIHRPRGIWMPQPRGRLIVVQVSGVKLGSLPVASDDGTTSTTASFKGVEALSASQLWDKARQGAFKAFVATLPAFWLRRPDACVQLEPNAPLTSQGLLPDKPNELVATFSSVTLLPTTRVNNLPASAANMRPPSSFQRRKDLTLADGHVVLLEYMEERPLLLSRPGMGVHIRTYYRRRDDNDNGYKRIEASGEAWARGHVLPLQTDDTSPFAMGQIAPGASRLAAECSMFRAAVFPHAADATDFLLMRKPTGQMLLRELTGCLAVGQQEPQQRVPTPAQCRVLLERRLMVWAVRELRRRIVQAEKRGGRASLAMAEVTRLFRLSEGIVRKVLRDQCNCERVESEDAEEWVLKPGSEQVPESRLRERLKPDEVCGWEAAQAAEQRLADMGLDRHHTLDGCGAEQLRLCAAQLFLSPERERAYNALEQQLLTAPWALTENFVSSMQEHKCVLEVNGAVGDPTAGRGFSYLREVRRAADRPRVGEALDGEPPAQEDLRKLSVPLLRAKLIHQANVDPAEIEGAGRWALVDLLKAKAEEAVDKNWADLLDLKAFARSGRTNIQEQQQEKLREAHRIFDIQANVLQGGEAAASEADDGTENSGDGEDLFDAELESSLAPTSAGPKGPRKLTQHQDEDGREDEDEDADERAEMDDLLQEQGIDAGADGKQSKKGKKPKLEAAKGSRRLRRVVTITAANGTKTTHELIYTGKEEISMLNMMCNRDPNGGFGTATIRGSRPSGKKAAVPGASPAKRASPTVIYKDEADLESSDGGDEAAASKEEAMLPTRFSSRRLSITGAPSGSMLGLSGHCHSDAGNDDVWEDEQTGPASPRAQRLMGRPSKTAPVPKAAPMTARKSLNVQVLRPILTAVRTAHKNQMDPFRTEVSKQRAPDYNNFVKPEDEMDISKIDRKIKNGRYSSAAELRADLYQIYANAEAYNSPGRGLYGSPGIVDWAKQLLDACDRELTSQALRVADAEERLQQEEPGGQDGWLECDSCKQWRIVSPVVFQAGQEKPHWTCADNFGRPGASCQDPPDYNPNEDEQG